MGSANRTWLFDLSRILEATMQRRLILLGFSLIVVSSIAWVRLGAQQPQVPFTPPDDIEFHVRTIMSEGVRMVGEVFSLKSRHDEKLPTIIMCHGWGGVAANLRPDAVVFARAGYLVVTF